MSAIWEASPSLEPLTPLLETLRYGPPPFSHLSISPRTWICCSSPTRPFAYSTTAKPRFVDTLESESEPESPTPISRTPVTYPGAGAGGPPVDELNRRMRNMTFSPPPQVNTRILTPAQQLVQSQKEPQIPPSLLSLPQYKLIKTPNMILRSSWFGAETFFTSLTSPNQRIPNKRGQVLKSLLLAINSYFA